MSTPTQSGPTEVTGSIDDPNANGHGGTARDSDVLEVAKGTGFTAAGAFFEFASRLVIAFLLTRALGVTDYGLYALAISVASIFTGIATLGLDDALVRYVAIQTARRDRAGVRGTLEVALGIPLAVGILIGGLMFFAADPIARRVFDEPLLVEPLRLMAAVVPFLTLSNVLLGAARGFRRMDIASLGENVIQTIVRLVILAVLSLVGFDVITALIVFGLSDVAASITMIILLDRVHPIRRAPDLVGRRDTREIVGFALPMWLSGLLTQFRKNIQDVTLAVFGVIADVGVYALAGRVNLVGRVFYRSVVVAVKPLLAHGHDQGDRVRLGAIYTMASRWLIALNLPFFLVMVLYPESILSVFGQGFATGATALVVLSWAELINAATGVCGSMIDMAGYTRIKLINSVIWLFLLLSASLLLVPPYGVLGAAWASFISLSTINLLRLAEVWWKDRLLPFGLDVWKPIVAAVVAYLAGLFLARTIPTGTDFWVSAWQGLVVITVYSGLVVVFGIDAEDRVLLGRVGGKIKRIATSRKSTGKTG